MAKEMQVNKINETKQYGAIYTVVVPVTFYFNKDGSYDGLDFSVREISVRDQYLIKELCEMLRDASNMEE